MGKHKHTHRDTPQCISLSAILGVRWIMILDYIFLTPEKQCFSELNSKIYLWSFYIRTYCLGKSFTVSGVFTFFFFFTFSGWRAVFFEVCVYFFFPPFDSHTPFYFSWTHNFPPLIHISKSIMLGYKIKLSYIKSFRVLSL